jgi:hypothetical protein
MPEFFQFFDTMMIGADCSRRNLILLARFKTMKRLYFAPLVLIFALMSFIHGPAALAQATETWVNYTSQDKIIRARMPFGFEETNEQFVITKTQAVAVGEAVGKFDARPAENTLKTYIVKHQQTFGLPFNFQDEIKELWRMEFDRYKAAYKDLDAEVASLKTGVFKTFPVGELTLNYTDKKFGQQAIRISIIFAKNTKIKQAVIGPPTTVTAFKTEDFFKNIIFLPDPIMNTKNILDIWQPRISPSKIFTVYAPQKSEIFMPVDADIKKGTRTDFVGFLFKDPAREQDMSYNVYGYVFKEGTNLTYSDVAAVIRSNHVLKRRTHDQDIVYNRRVAGQFGIVEAEYLVTPLPDRPYMDSVRIQATFKGNIMMVQESNSSLQIQRGPFVKTLFDAIKFHPEQYTP